MPTFDITKPEFKEMLRKALERQEDKLSDGYHYYYGLEEALDGMTEELWNRTNLDGKGSF